MFPKVVDFGWGKLTILVDAGNGDSRSRDEEMRPMVTVYFWLKAYDLYNSLTCNPNHHTRDGAYAEYDRMVKSGQYYFIQMGVMSSEEGSLVLNEYRNP
jgi:hypothetical protein